MMQRYLVSQVRTTSSRVLKEIATDLNVLLAQYMARPWSPRPRRIDHIRYLFLHHGRPLTPPTRGAGLPSGIHPHVGNLTRRSSFCWCGLQRIPSPGGDRSFLGAYGFSRITSCRRT